MNKDDFFNIYTDLVDSTRKLSNYGTEKYGEKLLDVLEKFINYLNDYYKTDVKVKALKITPGKHINRVPSQLNFENEMIEFDPETIKEIINEEKNNSHGEALYDDTSFAILLICIASHEFCHYLQLKSNRKGISEQNYLNSLSLLMTNYFEQPIEGEAYGFGVKMIYYFINNCYIPNEDIELFNQKMQNNSYIHQKISQQLLIYSLCNIPFMSYNGQFKSIIECMNTYTSKISKEELDVIGEKFPLIIIGISEAGKEKDANELVKQYIDRKLYFCNHCLGNISYEELNNLLDIYIYLLIPKLNKETYEELIRIYGSDEINNIINNMIEKIEIKKKEYEEAYHESLQFIDEVRDKELKTMKYDRDYINKKYLYSVVYLENSLNKLNNILTENKIKKKNH